MISWKKLKISNKLISVFVLLAIIPLLALSWFAYQKTSAAVEKEVISKLIAIRESKVYQIENYFNFIRNQIQTFAQSMTIVNAMSQFKGDVVKLEEELDIAPESIPSLETKLQDFYNSQFLPKLNQNSHDSGNISAASYIPGSTSAKILQNLYIVSNPNPAGAKLKLDTAGDASSYSKTHQTYHPIIKNYLEHFGFYDIFLVDPETGMIVYTVYKEVDFGTSLLTGPYKNSNIAHAFRQAVQSDGKEFVKLVDFQDYAPSYNAKAAFIATPIYNGKTKIGVLIFQMPIAEINRIMTNGNQWDKIGLGRSGESYIVGSDYTIKNESRFLMENKEKFLKTLEKKGYTEKIIDKIKKSGSAIGTLTIITKGTKAVVKGRTGTEIFPDYRNVPVVSSYTPLKLEDLKWAIMSEIDETEAFQAAYRLRNILLLITAALAILAIFVAFTFAKSLSRPIISLKNAAEYLGQGELTKKIEIDSQDEVGEAARFFNNSIEQLREIVINVKNSITDVQQTSEEIAEGSANLAIRTNEQASSITETSATLEEFSSTIHLNSQSAEETNAALSEFYDEIKNHRQLIEKMTVTIEEINTSSQQINGIVTVINDISFQTNLLALNAAVEAARAGEAGRGFAVVAAEVRNLAQKTAESSKNIQSMISENVESVNRGKILVNDTTEFFQTIMTFLENVSNRVQQIAVSTEQQSSGVDQINLTISEMEAITNQNASLAKDFASTVEILKQDAMKLNDNIARFKVADQSK